MEDKGDLRRLLKAAVEMPVVGDDLERRVMMAIARREIERSRTRARRGVIASLSGLAMLFAACVAAIVVWFPALLPDFARVSWLSDLSHVRLFEQLRDIRLPEFLDGSGTSAVADVPLWEQWGGLVLLLLLVAGAVGFVWYLNSLFSSDSAASD